MARIALCSILKNDSDTERQIISYDTEDKHLYSDAQEEPIDTPELDTIEDAENYCYAGWFGGTARFWEPEWIERDE